MSENFSRMSFVTETKCGTNPVIESKREVWWQASALCPCGNRVDTGQVVSHPRNDHTYTKAGVKCECGTSYTFESKVENALVL